jgi:hypothetical protein
MINNNCRFGYSDEDDASWLQTLLLPDVGVFARPGSKSFQLALWLAHPGVEEIELAKRPRTDSCIAVDRVISKKYKTAVGIR